MDDPLGFLRTNIIAMVLPPLDIGEGMPAPVCRISAHPQPAARVLWRTRNRIRHTDGRYFDLVPDGRGTVPAYRLPWSTDGGYHMVLPPDGSIRLMVNAVMNGCSFGYIRDRGTGAARVSHINIRQGMGATDLAAMRSELSYCQATLHRSRYEHDARSVRIAEGLVETRVNCSVFGLRDDTNMWRFYAQSWRTASAIDNGGAGGRVYEILDTYELTTRQQHRARRQ